MKNDLIVTLKVYRGPVNYNKKGEVISENQLIKLAYGRLEWKNFIKTAEFHYTKVEIEEVNEETISFAKKMVDEKPMKTRKTSYSKVDPTKEMIAEVEGCIGKKEKPLTPEQKRIADLEAKVEALTKGKTDKEPTSTTEETNPDEGDDLELARGTYLELFGKKPNFMMSLDKINKRIAEKQAEIEAASASEGGNDEEKLEEARVEYEKLFGKRPKNSKSLEDINKEIVDRQA